MDDLPILLANHQYVVWLVRKILCLGLRMPLWCCSFSESSSLEVHVPRRVPELQEHAVDQECCIEISR